MPLAIILAVLVLISFVHLGRAIANVLAGCDWRFPSRVDLFSSLPAVLRGDAGAGLVDLHGPGASPSSLLMCVAATELILLATTVVLIKLGLIAGAGTNEGRCDSSEAERLLGVARLRRSRDRPDLPENARRGFGDDLQSGRGWMASGPGPRTAGWSVVGSVGPHCGCDRSAGQRKDTRSSDLRLCWALRVLRW